MSALRVNAPAKINLGLEILGRRRDGFHEIRSVLAKITLCDVLEFSPAEGDNDEMTVAGLGRGVPATDNLVLIALNELRRAGCPIPSQRIRLTKRIPVAAGLGGASTDAAATISLFGQQAGKEVPELREMASRIGSDVPFFLGGDVALATGRGERLLPLAAPAEEAWVVVVAPTFRLPAKTATLYASIKPAWWTDGDLVDRFARSFPDFTLPPPPNVFERAMFSLRPEVASLRDSLAAVGFPFVAMSGAGPAMFTICDSKEAARRLAMKAAGVAMGSAIHVARLGETASPEPPLEASGR